jgi:hypothetical protein
MHVCLYNLEAFKLALHESTLKGQAPEPSSRELSYPLTFQQQIEYLKRVAL